MVYLYLLDDCTVRTRTNKLTPRAKKLFAIASYLILERGKFIPRRRLVQLFWPNIPERDARHPLREALRKLRRIGIPITSDEHAQHVTILRHNAIIDVDRLAHADTTDILTRNLEILPTYDPGLSPAHADWIDEARIHLADEVTRQLYQVIDHATSLNDWPTVHALTERLHPMGIPCAGYTQPHGPTHHTGTFYPRTRQTECLPLPLHARNATPAFPSRIHETPAAQISTNAHRPVTPTSPLIGRESDLDTLTHALTRAAQGHGAAIAIAGPPGIGKSRLAHEIAGLAHYEQALVVKTRCEAVVPATTTRQRNVTATFWHHLISALRQLPGAGGCDPTTNTTLDHALAGRDDLTHAASQHAPTQLYTAIIDLLDAITYEQPLILIVDDLHWADSASLALLQSVAEVAPRQALLWIATTRSNVSTTPATFERHTLGPLPPLALTRLLDFYQGGIARQLPDATRQWCAQTVDGNPLFAEELVNFWMCTPDDPLTTAPATSIHTLLDARLHRLDLLAQQLLQACAILGTHATPSRLAQTIRIPDGRLAALVHTLQVQALLAPLEGGTSIGDRQVRCRHDLIAEHALALLSDSELQTLANTASTTLDPRRMTRDAARHSNSGTYGGRKNYEFASRSLGTS